MSQIVNNCHSLNLKVRGVEKAQLSNTPINALRGRGSYKAG